MVPTSPPNPPAAAAPSPVIRRVDVELDHFAVMQLTAEYLAWVAEGVRTHVDPFAMFDAAGAEEVVKKLCRLVPPLGAFYLVEHDGEPAGMGGWRVIAPRVAEFKRIYLRPAFRGLRLGQTMVLHLVDDARACGCERAVLDTTPFMQAAQRLYAQAGFVDCAPYAGTEVPPAWHGRWRFMTRSL